MVDNVSKYHQLIVFDFPYINLHHMIYHLFIFLNRVDNHYNFHLWEVFVYHCIYQHHISFLQYLKIFDILDSPHKYQFLRVFIHLYKRQINTIYLLGVDKYTMDIVSMTH